MDWQAVGTIVALLGVIASFLVAIRGQRQDRQIAENSALRAEAATRLTEEYTTRVVDALESMAASPTFSGAVSLPPAPKVKWSMSRVGGERYLVENKGDATARDVHVEGHESLGGLLDVQGGPHLAPGEALTFIAAPSMATTDMTITVSWTNPDGTLGNWKYPLSA